MSFFNDSLNFNVLNIDQSDLEIIANCKYRAANINSPILLMYVFWSHRQGTHTCTAVRVLHTLQRKLSRFFKPGTQRARLTAITKKDKWTIFRHLAFHFISSCQMTTDVSVAKFPHNRSWSIYEIIFIWYFVATERTYEMVCDYWVTECLLRAYSHVYLHWHTASYLIFRRITLRDNNYANDYNYVAVT